MGAHISRKYFAEQIHEARALTGVLKVVYRDSDIKLILATVARAPVSVVRDYLMGSVKFIVSYRKSSGYTISSPIESDLIWRKILTYEEYERLKKLLYSLRNVLAAGSAPSKLVRQPSEECSIFLDAVVEVVLACGHSFCTKCAADWKDTNPTCPSCRQDLIDNAGEEWQLEDWNENDLKVQFEVMTRSIAEFLDGMPSAPPDITETHKVLDIQGDEWQLAVPSNAEVVDVELDESKEKPTKFMGL